MVKEVLEEFLPLDSKSWILNQSNGLTGEIGGGWLRIWTYDGLKMGFSTFVTFIVSMIRCHGYRALEEGRIQDAENEKNRLEQSQRERRKQREEERVTYSPKWFMWVLCGSGGSSDGDTGV